MTQSTESEIVVRSTLTRGRIKAKVEEIIHDIGVGNRNVVKVHGIPKADPLILAV